MLVPLFWLALAGSPAVRAQTLAPDQAGCVDSKNLPKLLECRIDNCEKKDSDHLDISVGEDEKGAAVKAVDGTSHSVMYECRVGATPVSIIDQAATVLKAAGFDIPYRFSEAEGALTARKDNLWITVEAASQYYTVREIREDLPDLEPVTDAASIYEMMDRLGHVPLYGIQFLPGRADLTPASDAVLGALAEVLNNHPDWNLRIEGHTDNTGSRMGNLTLSLRRATAVVSWMAGKGIKRSRLDPQGMADLNPIADNQTEAGRQRNRRIELMKAPSPPRP